VLNEINEACYSREQCGKIMTSPINTTKDADITGRNWLLVDADPKRPAGISSTDGEKANAKIVIGQIYKWLKIQGFEEPVVCDSGNGYHLLYKIKTDNSKENIELINDFLKVLDMYFSDNNVKIDTSVFNAARITKLYGTLSQKGEDSPDRPHRLSKILYVPDILNLTGRNYITRISDMLPKPEQKVYNGTKYNDKQFDLRDFIIKYGIAVKHEIKENDGTKYILENCIFDPSHKGKDAALFQYNNGALHFHCFHDSCSNYGWRDVRLKFEPDAYNDNSKSNGYWNVGDKSTPNHRKNGYIPYDFDAILANAPKNSETNEPEPIFYTTEQIRLEPEVPEEFIKSGIKTLDKKTRGFRKGEISCLSGETGSGKSTIISQFLLDAAQQDFRIALFSGEIRRKKAYNWLIYQAAGKKYIHPTDYESYFHVDKVVEEKISKWLDEKAFLYNNGYGNKFEFITEQLCRITGDKKIDLIILDNLMSMDIDDIAEDTNKQQTKFVESIKRFAEKNNVHIIFVAHPRKPNEFRLTGKYDICGSSNIVNFVDNLYIIYRVTETYKKLKGKDFHLGVEENVGSEMRICKDREGGNEDLFIPLYFESGSRRLKNSPDEIKFYGWQKESSNNTKETNNTNEQNNIMEITSEQEIEDLPWDGW